MAQLVQAVTPYHNHRRNQARAIGHFQGGAGFGGFIGSDAVQMHYPFKDKRLLELCLAAPGEVKVQAGYKRALVRTALDGLLPSPIQWRLSKEPFDPGYHLRYNRRRPSIARALAEISDADPVRELVDVEKLARLSKLEMSHARGATPQDFAAMHVVTGGMYLVAFLRMFDSFKLKTGHGEREQYFNLSEG